MQDNNSVRFSQTSPSANPTLLPTQDFSINGGQINMQGGYASGEYSRKSVVITSQNYGSLEEKQKIVLLSTEVERLYNSNKKLRAELASYLMKGDEGNVYVLQEDSWKLQFQSLQVEFTHLQDQYRALLGENQNLKSKEAELQALKNRVQQLEGQASMNADLQGKLMQVTRERDGIQAQFNELKKQLELMGSDRERLIRDLENFRMQAMRIPEFEQKLIQLSTENQRLNELLNAQAAQNQEALKKAAHHEREHGKMAGAAKEKASENDQLKAIIENLKRDNENLNKLLMERGREIESLRGQLIGLNQIEPLKMTIANLQKENENLNRIMIERTREIENLRAQIMNLQQVNGQIEGLKITITNLQRENENLNRVLMERAREIENLRGQIANLQQTNSQLDGLKMTITNLQRENENLNRALVERGKEIENMRIQILNLQQTASQIEGLKITITNLQKDNENLNRILAERTNEFQKNIAAVMGERDKLAREAEGHKAKAARLEELEKQLIQLSTELQRIMIENQRLQPLVPENQRLKELIDHHADQADQANKKAKAHEDYGKKMAATAQDKHNEAEQLKMVVDNLRRENENLNRLLVERAKENEAMRNQNINLQQANAQIEPLKATVANLQRDNENLNRILAERTNEFQKNMAAVMGERDKLAREAEGLKAKAARLEELEKQLIQLSTELQRIMIENQRLQPLVPENQRLKELIDHHADQADQANKKAKAHEDHGKKMAATAQDKHNEAEQLKLVVDNLRRENENLNRLLVERAKEIEAMRNQIIMIQQRESENTAKLMAEKNKEIEALRIQIVNLQQQVAQIEGLKITINNLQRDNENMSKALVDRSKEIEGLKMQIANLQQANSQIEGLKMTITNLQRENEGLNRILVERTNEFQKQLGQVMNDRDKLAREVEGLRLKATRCDELEKQLIQLSTECQRLAIENQKLIDELNRLKAELNLKTNQHDEAAKRARNHEDHGKKMAALAADKQNEAEALKAEIEKLKAQIEQMKFTIQSLQRDNENLNKILIDRAREIEELRKQLAAAQASASQLEGLKIQLQGLYKDNENLSKSCRDLELRLAQIQIQYQDSQTKVVLLCAENERLQGVIEGYIKISKDGEEWKKKFYNLDAQRMRELEDLRGQFEAYKRNNVGGDAQIKWNAERAAYETSILQLRAKIDDLTAQLKFYTNEGQRNSVAMRQSTVEMETIKKQRYEIELRSQQEIADLKAQLEQYKLNNLDARQLAIKFSAEKAADQSQIKQLQQMNDNLKAELEKVYELMNQRKAEYESVSKMNENLRKSYVEVTKVLKEKETYGDTNEVEFLKRRIAELEGAGEEFRKTAEKNSIELSRKNKELVDKIQELDVLKLKYEEAINNYQNLNSKLFTKLMNEGH